MGIIVTNQSLTVLKLEEQPDSTVNILFVGKPEVLGEMILIAGRMQPEIFVAVSYALIKFAQEQGIDPKSLLAS